MIVRRFAGIDPMHVPGVLVKNHGPFSWGKDAAEAVYHAAVMEEVAKMAAIAFGINPRLTMNPLLIRKHFSRKHGPGAYYGQKRVAEKGIGFSVCGKERQGKRRAGRPAEKPAEKLAEKSAKNENNAFKITKNNDMNSFNDYEVWFVTGAQLLYGGDAVIAVDAHSNEIVKGLNDSGTLPVKVVYKGTVNSSAEISKVFPKRIPTAGVSG